MRSVINGIHSNLMPAVLAARYLNRLSDLLFVMARLANTRAGKREQPWEPR